MKDELIFRVWSESVSYGDALEPEKILKFARAIELLSASEPAMAMPEEVRHALTHAIGGWRGAACGTRDDEEGERRSADYRRRAQVIEDWLAASTAAPAQSYWTKEQVAAVREDAKRLHAKLTPGKLVDDAPAKSGEPVYQIEQSNGSWLDVSSDAYESTEDYRRRIVYTAPHPSPTAVVLVDERSAFEVWWQALPTETNPQDCDTSYEADVKGWALMAWQARAVSPQPVEQTRALTDDARNAARYRWLQGYVFADRGRRGPAYFGLPLPKPVTDPMRGAVAEHFSAAIDAAMTAAHPASGGEK